jgi:signal transduction histidine kinase
MATHKSNFTPTEYDIILRECARINFGRVRLFALVLFLVHCFLLYRDFAVLRVEGYWERNIGYQHLCTMHIILVVSTALFLLFSFAVERLPESKEHLRRFYNAAFAWGMLCWCAVLAGWVNQHEHGLITEYVIAIFGIAASFYFPPVQSLLMFALVQGVFMVSVASILPEPNHSGHYTNTLAMVIIAWLLARTSFQLTAKNITNQEIIRQQTVILAENNTELTLKNARLEVLDLEKTELMGIAAHDLKNPITGILLATGIIRHRLQDLEEKYLPVAMEKIIGKLSDIDATAERMLDIINKLLNVNRIESGALTIQSVEFSLGTIVEAVVDFYAEHARPKNITLRLENQASEAQILADPQFVQEIIENLVSNAVKYSPPSLPIDVRLLAQGSTVRFEVQDYGPGLSSDDKKRLFGKFARLSARPTGGEHSTGLGLSIVKKLTEAMQGNVWCESEVGKGATFIVELPAATS